MIRKILILVLFVLFSSCEKNEKSENILKFYGDASEDIGYSISKSDGGYIIGGQLTMITRLGGNYIETDKSVKNLGIIKTDADGNIIWEKNFGDRVPSVGSKVLTLDDGSVICTGYAIDTVSLQTDIIVVKVDANGTNSLQKIYKSTGNQYGIDITKTNEGFLILGSTDVAREPLTDSTGNAGGKKDILLLRINNNLDQIISPIAIGFPNNDEGVALKPDINGGYIVVGTTERSIPKLEQAGKNILFMRVNADGSVTENRILGGLQDEYAADVEVLSDGYIIPVTVGSEGTNQWGYILKISDNIYTTPVYGSKIEINSSSSSTLSYSLKAISRYKTNSFILAGQVGIGTSADMLIFAVDADGNKVAGKEKITGGTGSQVANDVISDNDGNIIVVGKNSYENNSMISLLKFRF